MCVRITEKGVWNTNFPLHLPFRESNMGKDEITACIKVMVMINFWVIDVKRHQEFWSMKGFVYLSHLSEKIWYVNLLLNNSHITFKDQGDMDPHAPFRPMNKKWMFWYPRQCLYPVVKYKLSFVTPYYVVWTCIDLQLRI